MSNESSQIAGVMKQFKDFTFCSAHANTASQKIEFVENIEGINEWPHNWPDGEISYRLNNFTTDHEVRHQIRAVTVALRTWQLRITKLKFRRERSPDPSVDFEVAFQPQSKFNTPNVLAHAWFPGQGNISGDVEINDEAWDWVPSVHLQTLANPPLTSILIHEFGHSLGLRHDTTTQESIMYPSFNLGRRKIVLHARDITRIQERYGQRNLPEWIIKYFIERRLGAWDFT